MKNKSKTGMRKISAFFCTSLETVPKLLIYIYSQTAFSTDILCIYMYVTLNIWKKFRI